MGMNVAPLPPRHQRPGESFEDYKRYCDEYRAMLNKWAQDQRPPAIHALIGAAIAISVFVVAVYIIITGA
jgi:hypothetical protein